MRKFLALAAAGICVSLTAIADEDVDRLVITHLVPGSVPSGLPVDGGVAGRPKQRAQGGDSPFRRTSP